MPLAQADPNGDALATLRDQFVEAFSKGPTTVLETPAAPHAEDTVAGILQDELSSEAGLERVEELLRLVAYFAWRAHDQETRLAALDWICRAGVRHAERNCSARMLIDQGGSVS